MAVRLYGMQAEGVTPVQMSELRNEGVFWLFWVWRSSCTRAFRARVAAPYS